MAKQKTLENDRRRVEKKRSKKQQKKLFPYRLVLVDVFERVEPDLRPGPLRLQIDHLPRHEPLGPDGAPDLGDHVQDRLGGDAAAFRSSSGSSDSRRRAGNVLKRKGQQRVARQDRDLLSVDLVAGRDAAPEVIVVHAGEVVVDQRHRVQHLQCARGRHRVRCDAADELARGDAENGTHPLPSGK